MGPEFLALTSSVAWGSEAILVRRGSRYASVALAALMGFVLSTVALWTAIWLFFPLNLLYTDATWYFVISGLIQPAIVRFLHYTGIVRLGASRAGPVRSVTPLFAIALAFTFLGERPEAAVYLGSLLSVVGVWLTSSRREGESEWKAIHLAYPLGAAFLTAISQNFRKTGLRIMPNPFVATAVTITTSLAVFSLSLVATGQMRATFQGDRKCLPFYGTAAGGVGHGPTAGLHRPERGRRVGGGPPHQHQPPLHRALQRAVPAGPGDRQCPGGGRGGADRHRDRAHHLALTAADAVEAVAHVLYLHPLRRVSRFFVIPAKACPRPRSGARMTRRGAGMMFRGRGSP